MAEPFEGATHNIAVKVARFVEASDRLVNLLTREHYAEAEKDAAMNAYDIARRGLTGEDVSSA